MQGNNMHKILLVDDDAVLRDMVARRLQKKEFHVIVAENGEQACVLARSEQPQLILMDLRLKGSALDGWETTKVLKAAAETRAIPIIALTADAVDGVREKTMQNGCDEFETKPIDFPALLEKMHKLLMGKEKCA